MFKEAIDYYGKMSWKTRQRSEEYNKIKDRLGIEIFVEASTDIDRRKIIEELKFIIANENEEFYKSLLLENLQNAVIDTVEYNRNISGGDKIGDDDLASFDEEMVGQSDVTGKPFWEALIKILRNNTIDIVYTIIESGILGIYEIMDEIAGTDGDFWEGIQYARSTVNASGKNESKAAQFWKNVVWPNPKLYANTVSLRFDSWGDSAPYWIWIENGNANTSAFPQFGATNFLYNSAAMIYTDLEKKAIARYEEPSKEGGVKDELDNIKDEFNQNVLNAFEEAERLYRENPQNYQPGHIFRIVHDLETNRDVKIRLTLKRREIGSVMTRKRKTK